MKTKLSLLLPLLSYSQLQAADNEFLGTNAGGTGASDRNVVIGDEAGANMTTMDENVVIGAYAGATLTERKTSVYNGVTYYLNGENVILGFRAGGLWTQEEWSAYLLDPIANPLPDLDENGSPGVEPSYYTNASNATKNVFIGHQAGLRNHMGSDGVFVGWNAGMSNTLGQDNTFIGQEAGRDNTKGTDNTFVGEDSGRGNTLGNDNTAIGSRAMFTNQLGRFNTSVGSDAGQEIGRHGFTLAHERAVRNTSIGNAAGYDIGVGNSNTMIGDNAGANTEHADFNTFVGQHAGFDNNRTNEENNANRNTSLGAFSGYSNRKGEDNVWIGVFSDSGQWLTAYDHALLNLDMEVGPGWTPTPSFNPTDISPDVNRTLVLGSFASARNDDSIALGYNSRTIQDDSITIGNASKALGAGDITIGTNASSSHDGAITIGNSAVSHGANLAVIGTASTVGWDPGADGVTALGSSTYRFSSATAVTFSAEADAAANAVVSFVADAGAANDDKWKLEAVNGGDFKLASFSTGSYVDILSAANTGDVTVAGDLNVNSDRRLKENIQPISNAPELLSKLEGKTYHWKKDLGRNSKLQYGLIAQEVEAVIPEMVSTSKEDGIKSVNYQAFVPLLIDSVNDLKKQNELQSQEIALLKKQIELQQQILNTLNETAQQDKGTTVSR